MNARDSVRRGTSPLVVGLCLTAAVVVLVPRVALAADAGAPTIRATIGSTGAVSSVQQYAPSGAASAFGGQLPISMKITHTASGTNQTYTYHVENTFSQTQTVHYDDTSGLPHHTSVVLQLPLVAQLGVDVPKSFGLVTQTGATVTSDADGTRHLLWNMVLFTPLGSSVQDVSVSADGTGSPVAELRATAVDPTTTPGLSSASQSATANYQQDDFWAGYASGGNGGLTQLSTGTAGLVSGLVQLFAGATQLHTGIVTAGAGANKLDAGTKSAYAGSQQLSGGLDLIHGGLDQLADPAKGLPAASAGLKQLQAGVQAVLAGLGNDTTSNTLINGVDQLAGGLSQITGAFTDPTTGGIAGGIACATDVVGTLVNGSTAAVADPCWASAPFSGTRPVLPALSTVPGAATYGAILGGVLTQALTPISSALQGIIVPGLTQLAGGATLIRAGLSHAAGTAGPKDQGGVKEGLAAINAGMTKLKAGLNAAVGGISKLDAGSGTALTGSQALSSGLGKLSAGQHLVATGLPAAVTGTGSLADGLGQALDGAKKIHAGIGSVQSGATGPLASQLVQASQNNHKQLAVLQSAAGLASQGPGGSGAAYVLTQRTNGTTALSATNAAATSSSHTGRNVGIGVGGFLLLLVGLGSGFALGGRRRVHAG